MAIGRSGLLRTAMVGAGILWVGTAVGQDVLTVAPDAYKKVAESSRARALELTLKPGAKIASHTHPDHMLYFMTDATLVLKREGKTPYEMNFTAGQALFLPAQTAALENVGGKPVRALVVELKPAAKATAPVRARRGGRKPRR
jgi:quercetin dioxygenase-like cupin family protein